MSIKYKFSEWVLQNSLYFHKHIDVKDWKDFLKNTTEVGLEEGRKPVERDFTW